MPHWIKDILIALGIVAAALAVVVLAFFSLTRGISCGAGKEQRVDADFTAFTSALKTYKLNASHYPSTAQGFQALITRPAGDPEPRRWTQLMDLLPLDPWGNPYVYTFAPPRERHSFTLRSLGKDGIAFTADDIVREVN